MVAWFFHREIMLRRALVSLVSASPLFLDRSCFAGVFRVLGRYLIPYFIGIFTTCVSFCVDRGFCRLGTSSLCSLLFTASFVVYV